MKVVQCRLRRGTTVLVAWLPVAKRFRVGNQVTLNGETGRWTVVTKGKQERDVTEINRGFRVGGL